MNPYPVMNVSGTTPGADTNTDTMWSSRATVNGGRQYPKNFFAMHGIHRAILRVSHDNDGTVNWYDWDDVTGDWTQVGTHAATAVSNEDTRVDIHIGGHSDWKIEWVNGGSAQTVWTAYLTLTDDQSKIT